MPRYNYLPFYFLMVLKVKKYCNNHIGTSKIHLHNLSSPIRLYFYLINLFIFMSIQISGTGNTPTIWLYCHYTF